MVAGEGAGAGAGVAARDTAGGRSMTGGTEIMAAIVGIWRRIGREIGGEREMVEGVEGGGAGVLHRLEKVARSDELELSSGIESGRNNSELCMSC